MWVISMYFFFFTIDIVSSKIYTINMKGYSIRHISVTDCGTKVLCTAICDISPPGLKLWAWGGQGRGQASRAISFTIFYVCFRRRNWSKCKTARALSYIYCRYGGGSVKVIEKPMPLHDFGGSTARFRGY